MTHGSNYFTHSLSYSLLYWSLFLQTLFGGFIFRNYNTLRQLWCRRQLFICVQLLVWFILQGRLNTKERLFRFGLHGIEDNLCVFCKEEPETVDHVIFGCSWMDAPFIKFDKKLWCSLFYVTARSIW
ncbi:uncharacterized protein LOC125220390 [Salvia hispanica]|uniref:uncharacterized protein LOC125220390 n=1 Tax=Salvia hispanica TaxID=49212 RepID=UPI0020096F22|nr:uncharacterized protein LOC125220390 [Salvia hispanica]